MKSLIIWEVTQCLLIVTKVSGQPAGRIFKDQAVQVTGTDVLGHIWMPFSRIRQSKWQLPTFWDTYGCHFQGSGSPSDSYRRFGTPIYAIFKDQAVQVTVNDVSGQLSIPSSRIKQSKWQLLMFRDNLSVPFSRSSSPSGGQFSTIWDNISASSSIILYSKVWTVWPFKTGLIVYTKTSVTTDQRCGFLYQKFGNKT
jgi:hypothetical protein